MRDYITQLNSKKIGMIPSQMKNQIQYSKIRNQKIAQVLLYWTMLLGSLWFERSKRVQNESAHFVAGRFTAN